MTVDVRPIPRPGGTRCPGEGVVGVVGRVLVREEEFFVAPLRFAGHAIDPHPASS